MNLNKLHSLTEKLRKQAIGDPSWIAEKGVFEYRNHDIKVVAVLKAVRAAQGITALDLLCKAGLFVDMGAIFRCVHDCTAEIYFLFEKYPKTSVHVDQFVKAFFESTIDGFLSATTEPVLTKKIHSAMVRTLTGSEQDEEIRKRIQTIYKTFSGYTHANYSHIMQMYGGTRTGGDQADLSFNLGGVPSFRQREKNMEFVKQAYLSVLHAVGFITATLGLRELNHELSQAAN